MKHFLNKKIKGQWEDLECIYLYWDLFAYVPNEDKQIKQKLDIEKYYGILKNVKDVAIHYLILEMINEQILKKDLDGFISIY